MDAEPIRAAGAVLWRPGTAGPEVAVVHRPRYDDWSLPKGKVRGGETEAAAARREVEEETGFAGEPGADLGTVAYATAAGPKVVRYWAMRVGAGAFTRGREVDALRWVRLEEAAALLTYTSDREVLARFAALPPPSQ